MALAAVAYVVAGKFYLMDRPSHSELERSADELMKKLVAEGAVPISLDEIPNAKADSSKIKRESYDKLSRGMSKNEVLGILGPPTHLVDGNENRLAWDSKTSRATIFVQFDGHNRVDGYSCSWCD